MKIIALVVTYNRIALLKECIEALRLQTRRPDAILAVNNGSTDGSTEWLDSQPDVQVIHQANLGGAGGFFTGQKHACEVLNADAVWCMDDDTIPHATAMEELLGAWHRISSARPADKIGWLCSMDYWTDGELHPMNVPALHDERRGWLDEVLRLKAVRCASASYVSILISADAMAVAGYVRPEMFIWGDDVEHTARVLNQGYTGWLALESRCMHKSKEKYGARIQDMTNANFWKFKWQYRNAFLVQRSLAGNRTGKALLRFFYGLATTSCACLREGKGCALPSLWYLSIKGCLRHLFAR